MTENVSADKVNAIRVHLAALRDKENSVSYWRRIIQGCIDVRGGMSPSTPALAVAEQAMKPAVLASEEGRSAYLSISGDIAGGEPIPGLQNLWDRFTSVSSDGDVSVELNDAEFRLSALRSSLHKEIDALTAQLVIAYRENPELIDFPRTTTESITPALKGGACENKP